MTNIDASFTHTCIYASLPTDFYATQEWMEISGWLQNKMNTSETEHFKFVVVQLYNLGSELVI